MELFATSQNALWHIWQIAPNGGWGAWSDLGAPSGASGLAAPAVGSNTDGQLEVFAYLLTPGSSVRHLWKITPNAGAGAGAVLFNLCLLRLPQDRVPESGLRKDEDDDGPIRGERR